MGCCPYCFDWEGMPMGLENGNCPACGFETDVLEEDENEEGRSIHGGSDADNSDAGNDDV